MRDADFLNQMLYLDTKIFMPSLNLNYNDKMSMASSVEVRVPFLDRELAEFAAWNVPPNLKLKGFLRPTTKHIFRRAMQDDSARWRFYGSPKPVSPLLSTTGWQTICAKWWMILLSETNIRQRGLFKPELRAPLCR